MGKYDRLTGCIVDALWIIIKQSYKWYEETGQKLYATKVNRVNCVLPFKYQMIIGRDPGSSQYKLDATEYKNKITFCLSIDPELEPDFYKELNIELQGTVRHELEHILQENGVKDKAKYPTAQKLRQINKDTNKYLNAKSEIGPMVHGFYRIAKTKKEKLDQVMIDFLNDYIKNKSITKAQSYYIKRKWMKYARQYFPKAQYTK